MKSKLTKIIALSALAAALLPASASAATIRGNEGDNGLSGTPRADLILGYGGSDTLLGQQGLDNLWGGTGNDYMSGFDGDDRLYGEDGNDQLFGGWGVDTMNGQDGDDRIVDEKNPGFMSGGNGSDTLMGGTGANRIFAADRYGDRIHCGAGTDNVQRDRFDVYVDASGSPTTRAGAGCEQVSFVTFPS